MFGEGFCWMLVVWFIFKKFFDLGVEVSVLSEVVKIVVNDCVILNGFWILGRFEIC